MPTLTEWAPSRARGPRQGPIRGEVWGRGRLGQEWVSPQAQPARGGHTRPPATSASECTAHPAVTMLGAGEGAFLHRSPLGTTPARPSSQCVRVNSGCGTWVHRLQPGAEGRWRVGTASLGGHRRTRTSCGQPHWGPGTPSCPLSIAGKALRGSELSRVLSASSSFSLVPLPSYPLGTMHAASSPASLSDRAVIGEFPYK